jgi:hypothetical protein
MQNARLVSVRKVSNIILLMIVILFTGCVGTMDNLPRADLTIKIRMVDGCPVGVSSDYDVVYRGNRVRWESDPRGHRFSIVFDPIEGQKLRSRPDGILQRPIDGKAPENKDYEYTIVAKNGDCLFDPHIRVGQR